jgi:hypothetical protein
MGIVMPELWKWVKVNGEECPYRKYHRGEFESLVQFGLILTPGSEFMLIPTRSSNGNSSWRRLLEDVQRIGKSPFHELVCPCATGG